MAVHGIASDGIARRRDHGAFTLAISTRSIGLTRGSSSGEGGEALEFLTDLLQYHDLHTREEVAWSLVPTTGS